MCEKIMGEFWTPKQILLVKSVEQLPILYMKTLDKAPTKDDLLAAWCFISMETAVPSSMCKLWWSIIRWSFLKVHQLMKVHRLSRFTLETHPQSRKYLDGNLDFLNPQLNDFTDADIPWHVHKRFDRIFNVQKQASLEMVDLWLKNREEPGAHCSEYCKGWPEHDVSYLNNQVKDMSLTYQGKTEEEGPSTSSSGQGKGDDNMCISSDSEEEE